MAKSTGAGSGGRSAALRKIRRSMSSVLRKIAAEVAAPRERHEPVRVEPMEPRLLMAASIQGTVFADLNYSGHRDPGENGVADWTVFLDENLNGQFDQGERQTSVDKTGVFVFSKMEPGFYDVGVLSKGGWKNRGDVGPIQTVTVGGPTAVEKDAISKGKPVANTVISGVDFPAAVDFTITASKKAGADAKAVTLDVNASALKAADDWIIDWGDGSSNSLKGKSGKLDHVFAKDAIYTVQPTVIVDGMQFKLPAQSVTVGDGKLGRYVPGVGYEFEDDLRKNPDYPPQPVTVKPTVKTVSTASLAIPLTLAEYLEQPETLGSTGGVMMLMSTSDLIAHWTFDDAEGGIVSDIAPAGAYATRPSGEWTYDNVRGWGLQLDGSSQYMRPAAPNGSSLDMVNNYTIAGWIKLDELGREHTLVSKLWTKYQKQYSLGITAGNKLRFDSEYNGNDWHIESSATLDGQWHHVAVTVGDGTSPTVTLYIDGVSAGTATMPHTPLPHQGEYDVTIGRRSGTYNDNYFKGIIGDLRAYSRPLDSQEVADLVSEVLPSVSVEVSSASVDETSSTPVSITFTRVGDGNVGDLVVNYTVTGNATRGVDFSTNISLTGSVTILDGDPSATIDLSPLYDQIGLGEGSEYIHMDISPAEEYAVGEASSATITLNDADRYVTATEDAYVRGGWPYAYENYGHEEILVAKYDGSTSYTWESYLKFDLTSLADASQVSLRLNTLWVDPGGEGAVLNFYTVSPDWWEPDLRWDNRPTAGTLIGSYTNGVTIGKTIEIDVTDEVGDALAAGQSELAIWVKVQSGSADGKWVEFGSRDHADPSKRPVLIAGVQTPALAITGSTTVTPGIPQTFTFTASQPADNNTQWWVDWGDGSAIEKVSLTGNSVAVAHTYATDDSFTIKAIARGSADSISLGRRLEGETSFESVISTDNPLGYWKLNEAPSQQADGAKNSASSTASPDGVYATQSLWNHPDEPHPPIAQQPGWVFDGVETAPGFYPAYVEIPHTGDLASTNLDSGALSFFFSDGTLRDAALFSNDIQGNGAGQFSISTKPKPGDTVSYDKAYLQVRIDDGTTVHTLESIDIADPDDPDNHWVYANTWHHVAVTWGGSGLKLYIDGQLAAENPNITTGLEANTQPAVIGGTRASNPSGGEVTNVISGRIDEVAIFDTQLTADRIQAHFFAEAATLTVSPATAGGLILTENSAFHTDNDDDTELGYKAFPLDIGNNNTLTISFSDLSFDGTHTGEHINDALELLLLGPDQRSVVATIAPGSDAFFNLTESVGSSLADGVTYDSVNGLVKLDVSKLHGQSVTLLARLINNDTDAASEVTLPVDPSLSTEILSTPPTTPTVRAPAPRIAVDFDAIDDVSAYISTDYQRTSFDEDANRLTIDLTLTNDSAFAIRGPLLVALRNVTGRVTGDPADAIRLDQPDGITPDGLLYLDLSSDAFTNADRVLGSGESVSVTVDILNPDRVQFNYDLTFLGQLNTAPAFTSDPYTDDIGNAYPVETLDGSGHPQPAYVEIVATPGGNTQFRYQLAATDREGDAVTYAILQGPDGLDLDASGTVLIWMPQTSQVGSHSVRLRATDAHGLYDPANDQTFTLRVVTGVANRPPRFTSTPVVDAYVGQQYVYQAVATDPDGDDLYYTLISNPNAPGGDITLVADSTNEGRLTWTPQPGDVGKTFTVTLRVGDRHSPEEGFDIQTYELRASADPANRPPVIVTTPSTAHSVSINQNTTISVVDPARLQIHMNEGDSYVGSVSITLPDLPDNVGADIVFVVDESGSMGESNKQDWIDDAILAIELQLLQEGIGTNRYGLVGFGSSNYGGDDARSKLMSTDSESDGYLWGTAAEASATVSTLTDSTGGREDGYNAIEFAVDNYAFRAGAARVIVLVTDEYREDEVAGVDLTTLEAAVSSVNADLNFVVPVTFYDDSVPPGRAMGAAADGVVYLGDGQDSFTMGTYGSLLDWYEDSAYYGDYYGNDLAVQSYVEPLWTIFDGIAWGIGEVDTNTVDQFVSAFVDANFDIIEQQLEINVRLVGANQALADTFVNYTGQQVGGAEETLTFNIGFDFDGQPDALAIQFYRTVDQSEVGLVPVSISTGYDYFINAIDPDGDLVSYDLIEAPPGMHVDPSRNLIYWDPTIVEVGSHEVTVRASDGRGGEDIQTWTIAVADTSSGNASPVLNSVSPLTQAVGQAFVIPIDAVDPDGDAVVFALVNEPGYPVPSNVVINPHSGTITWNDATRGQLGIHELKVVAYDNLGNRSDEVVVSVTIEDPNADNHRPIIDSEPVTNAEPYELYSYTVVASDVDNDKLALSLPVAPEGMLIDVDGGTIFWIPNSSQNGANRVIVQVSDGRGGVALDSFDVTVTTPNQGPVITSEPVLTVQQGRTWNYQIRAYDPDSDNPLVLDTVSLPLVADYSRGVVSWDTSGLAVGTVQAVTITVRDSEGAEATQTFQVGVVAAEANHPPVLLSQPRSEIGVGQLFVYRIDVADADNDPLTITVEPDLIGNNWLDWDEDTLTLSGTPQGSNIGSNKITVTVSDGQGSQISQEFDILVTRQSGNTAPQIVAKQYPAATVGQTYRIRFEATDLEGDPTYWWLESSPDPSMVIDRETGELLWTPKREHVGTQEITVRVKDALGATSTATFPIEVRGVNTPPQIRSVSPVVGGSGFAYVIRAKDVDGDPITMSLTPGSDLQHGVNGVVFDQLDSETAILRWDTPTPGTFTVEVQAEDGKGGVDVQSFDITFTATAANQSPTVTPEPGYNAVAGQVYAYDFYATDPDGGALTVTLAQKPGREAGDVEMALAQDGVDPTLWHLTWTPGVGHAQQSNIVVIEVQDAAGAKVTYRFGIGVRATANQPPQLVDGDQAFGVYDGHAFSRVLRVSDPDHDPLTFVVRQIDGSPVPENWGITIDSYGRISSTVNDAPRTVKVVVTDPYGGSDEAQITFNTATDSTGPVVTVKASTLSPRPGTLVRFLVTATDAGIGLADLGLTVNGQSIVVNSDGTASYEVLSGATPGSLLNVVATAVDAANNSATSPLTLTVYEVPPAAPTVTIASPGQGEQVTSPTSVVGTITGGPSVVWKVEMQPLAGGPAITIAEGSGPVSGYELAVLDPTLLTNGQYFLIVTADNTPLVENDETVAARTVDIQSNVKLGNFALSFTDLTIPVLGIPISVQRSYDTLRADQEGDFGYGWELGLFDVKLETDVQAGANSFSELGLDNIGYGAPFRNGTRVTITMPDGASLGFTATVEPIPSGMGGFAGGLFGLITQTYRLTFLPDVPGTQLTLTSPVDVTLNEYGEMTVSGLPYNPASFDHDYRLTIADGTQYSIASFTGRLQNISDRLGHTLQVDDNGVYALDQNGAILDGVRIERDQRGRIIEVGQYNPATGGFLGDTVNYAYDAKGNLVSVTDRSDRTTTMAYAEGTFVDENGDPIPGNPVPDHVLTSITDARSVKVLEVRYTINGRIESIRDASTASANFGYTITDPSLPAGHTIEGVADANDVPTELVRNGRGNTVRRVQRLSDGGTPGSTADDTYLVTVYEYADAANPDSPTAVSESFQTSHADRFTASPTVWLSRTTYDASGNVETTTDAAGAVTRYGNYDRFGNPGFITDPLGNTTTNSYDNGNLTRTQDASGAVTDYTYDSGNLHELHQYTGPNGTGDRILVASYDYDERGRLTSATDADPDGSGPLTSTTRHFVYDAAGNQTLSYYVWTDPTAPSTKKTLVSRTDYDAEGRVTRSRAYTIAGEHTYSAASDLDSETADWSTSTEYNAVGQVETSIDRFGTISRTRYDLRGNVVETATQTKLQSEVAAWIVTRTFYDANGRAVATTDPLLIADASGQPDGNLLNLVTEADAGADRSFVRVTHTLYDALGRVVETRRLAGIEITSQSVPNYTGIYSTAFNTGYAGSAILSSSTTAYDSQGRVQYTVNHNIQSDSGDDARTDYYYDAGGRQTAVLGPIVTVVGVNGGTPIRGLTEYIYDDAGRQTSVTTNIAITQTTNLHPDITNSSIRLEADKQTTSFQYDALGRVTRTLYANGTSTATTYDARGRRSAETDALGRRTDYAYDDAGRLETVTLPAVDDATTPATGLVRPVYRYAYDAYGNQVSITDPNGHQTRFTYDEQGRQLSRTLPLEQTERWEYDAVGRVDVHYDFKGQATQYIYDNTVGSGGRLIEEQRFTGQPDATPGEATVYAYDALGRRATVREYVAGTLQRTTNYAYNVDGQITQADSPEGTVNYAYDDLGRVQRIYTGSGGNDTTYAYDDLGRLSSLNVTVLHGQSVNLTTSYTYNLLGQLHTQTDPNGVVTTYAYDELNRAVEVVATKDSQLLFRQEITYTADGQRDTVLETRDDASQTLLDYDYDALNRLVSERRDVNNDDTPGSQDDPGDYIKTFGFDLNNNRVTLNVDKPGSAEDDATASTYNANDQLTQTNSTLSGTTTFGYDDNGSLTTETTASPGGTKISHWNLRNQLQAVDANGDGDLLDEGDVSHIAYDHDGVRVSRGLVTASGGGQKVTLYLQDGSAVNPTGYSQVIEQAVDTDADGQIDLGELTAAGDGDTSGGRSYVLGHQVEAQSDSANGTLTLLHDVHGSTRALINLAGVILANSRFDYDAHGNALNFDPTTSATRVLYTNQMYDPALAQYLLRARGYRPDLGIFTSLDPYGGDPANPLTLNKYLYTHANPVIGVDPSGMFTLSGQLQVRLMTAAIIGAVLGPVINGVHNFATGQALTANIKSAALAGFTLAPIAALSSVAGTLIGLYGIYSTGTSAWKVINNSDSSLWQKTAAVSLTLLSIGGTYAAARSSVSAFGRNAHAEQTAPLAEVHSLNSGQSQPQVRLVPRLPQDIAVNPSAPSANGGSSTIGTNPAQAQALTRYVSFLRQNGAQDIRVNQQQVNINRVRVGLNQPDLQFTWLGRRWYIEWDSASSSRGIGHAERSLANDPDGSSLIFTLE